jgi:hypothetical protein
MSDSANFSKWKSNLKQRGVDLVDPYKVHLRCRKCLGDWYPDIQTGGGFLRGYAICPFHACNKKRNSSNPTLTANQ